MGSLTEALAGPPCSLELALPDLRRRLLKLLRRVRRPSWRLLSPQLAAPPGPPWQPARRQGIPAPLSDPDPDSGPDSIIAAPTDREAALHALTAVPPKPKRAAITAAANCERALGLSCNAFPRPTQFP